jgi:pimeloyl-ACP methyl ester carboxylesterase
MPSAAASLSGWILGSVAVLLVICAAIAAFVGLSVTGRGTRPALGSARDATSGDLRIVYYDAGEGPAVVLLASWARLASDFNELAHALHDAGYRTLAIESRGIGGSGGGGQGQETTLHDLARDVAAVLDASGVQDAPVHLVGHAFGNQVARTFASDFPERARSVTLVAAGGQAKVPPKVTQALFHASLSFMPPSFRERALRFAFFAPGNEIPDYWKTGWALWGGLAQSRPRRRGAPRSSGGRAVSPSWCSRRRRIGWRPPRKPEFRCARNFRPVSLS